MNKSRPLPILVPFLFFVSAVFIGILIFAYIETKKANPQMIEVGCGQVLDRLKPALLG